MTGQAPLEWVLDANALAHNLAVLRELSGEDQHFIASIKANAYGHGAVAIAQHLETAGVHSLATGSVEEAQAIRAAGVKLPILLFASTPPEGLHGIVQAGFIPTITSFAGAQALSRSATQAAPVYIKVDAGLGRLGNPIAAALDAIERIAALAHLRLDGLYTHAAFGDARGRDWATTRLRAFDDLLEELAQRGLQFPITQARASSCVLAGLTDNCNAVCVGHALYGLYPMARELMRVDDFKPVAKRLTSRLIHVEQHGQGADVAIAGLFSIERDRTIGVLPIGLGAGLARPRGGNQPEVLVRGCRVPVLAVSLEHTTLDLDACPDARPGDEVTLVGDDGGERISLTEFAAMRDATPLEALMQLSIARL